MVSFSEQTKRKYDLKVCLSDSLCSYPSVTLFLRKEVNQSLLWETSASILYIIFAKFFEQNYNDDNAKPVKCLKNRQLDFQHSQLNSFIRFLSCVFAFFTGLSYPFFRNK